MLCRQKGGGSPEIEFFKSYKGGRLQFFCRNWEGNKKKNSTSKKKLHQPSFPSNK